MHLDNSLVFTKVEGRVVSIIITHEDDDLRTFCSLTGAFYAHLLNSIFRMTDASGINDAEENA